MWFTFTLFDLNLFFPFAMLWYLSYLKWSDGIWNFDNTKSKLQTLLQHTHTHTAHRIPHTHTNEKSIFFDRRISNSAQKFPRFHSKTRQITDFQYDCCKRQCRIHAYSYMCMCICVCDPFNIEMTLRFCFSFQRVMKLFGGFYSDLFLVNSNQLNTDGYMPLKWKCL